MKLVSRKDLHVDKYLACLEKDRHAPIYAQVKFLDAVADNWQVLVLGDYDTVIPLPVRRSSGVKYVYQPIWCQQLGVFGNRTDVTHLINYAAKKFIKFDYCLRGAYDIGTKRSNLILGLDHSYLELSKRYSKNRKRDIQKAKQAGLTLRVLKEKSAIQAIALRETRYLKFERNYSQRIENLINSLSQAELIGLEVCHGARKVAGLFGIQNKDRIYFLHPFTFKEHEESAKNHGAMSFLVDSIINHHANSNRILDFEGSMVPGVARFYSSFGAQEEIYTHVKKSLFGMIHS